MTYMEKPLIIANWKMHPQSSKDAFDLASAVKKGVESLEVEAVLCPPFVYISELLPSLNVFIGAQDCAWEQEGAYTGGVSPAMLKNLGCSHVIVGHSERKQQFGETHEMIQKKVKAALAVSLIPVVCIGAKTKEELQSVLEAIPKEQVAKAVFAYEPEWAISTSPDAKAENPMHAKEVLDAMRKMIEEYARKETALRTRVIYGGSVNSKDIRGFLDAGFQGALVGAASLDAQEFIALVKTASLG